METSRQGIADVFATFYADLYASHQAVDYVCGDPERHGDLPEVTGQEVELELENMARKKTGDKTGIGVEMLQHGSAHLRTVIAELFTDILKEGTATPASWKNSFVTVFYKKREP